MKCCIIGCDKMIDISEYKDKISNAKTNNSPEIQPASMATVDSLQGFPINTISRSTAPSATIPVSVSVPSVTVPSEPEPYNNKSSEYSLSSNPTDCDKLLSDLEIKLGSNFTNKPEARIPINKPEARIPINFDYFKCGTCKSKLMLCHCDTMFVPCLNCKIATKSDKSKTLTEKGDISDKYYICRLCGNNKSDHTTEKCFDTIKNVFFIEYSFL